MFVKFNCRPSVEQLEGRELPALLVVSPSGSDSNEGGESAPLLTLQAAANRVAPGDVVAVRAGTYRAFNLTTSGTAADRITFRADPGVVLNQPNPWNNVDGINLEGASYATIEGFTVTGIPRAGIRAVDNQFVEFRNNVADSNGVWGFFTGFSSDLLIENNQASRSGQQHGIYVSNSADRPVVRGNTVFENRASGIQLNADLSQGGDGIISSAVIENNVLRANGAGGGASINLDGVHDSLVQNNLIREARATGIGLFRQDGATGSRNNRIVNNTVVVDNSANANSGRWAISINGESTGNRLFNNVFFSTHGFRGGLLAAPDSLAGLVSDYNVAEARFSNDNGATAISLGDWRSATGQDANTLGLNDTNALNALFVNRPAGDHRLAPAGAAVDRGTAAGAPGRDIAGLPRPSGAGVDVGAYEVPTAPTLRGVVANGGAPGRSQLTTLAVTFDAGVTLAPGAFTLTRQSDGMSLTDGGSAPQVAVAQSVADGRAVATLTFTGGSGRVEAGSLADGVWVLSIDRAKVTNAVGPMAADYATPGAGAGRLHRLFGDGDGDGDVDASDLFGFRRAFNTSLGQVNFRADLDFDGDGDVDNLDMMRFRQRYNRTI